MRIAFTAVLLLAVALPRPAHSSAYKQANQYFQVRDRAQVADKFAPDELQTQPQHFVGKLVEVKGVIKAIAGSDTQTTLLIDSGQTTYTVGLPPTKNLSTWPFLDVNTSVRALCQVVTVEGSSSGALELVIPVKEYEAAGVDQARSQAAEAAVRRVRAAQRPSSAPAPRASRGMGAQFSTSRQQPNDAQLVAVYADAINYFNRRLPLGVQQRIAWNIIRFSRLYGLDARLIMAVVACESNFNPNAVSRVGAQGLGQLMPGTASDLGVGDAFDMDQNLNGSVRLLSSHMRSMSAGGRPGLESVKLALACYNAGLGAVRKYKGIPPYQETQNYVRKITRLYWQMLKPEERTWTPG